jgi:hypothetical protein
MIHSRRMYALAALCLATAALLPLKATAEEIQFDAEGNPTSLPGEYIEGLKSAYLQHKDGQVLQKALFTLISNCQLDGETMAGYATNPEMATMFLFIREFFGGGKFYGRTYNGVAAQDSRDNACMYLACNTGAGPCPERDEATSPTTVTATVPPIGAPTIPQPAAEPMAEPVAQPAIPAQPITPTGALEVNAGMRRILAPAEPSTSPRAQ